MVTVCRLYLCTGYPNLKSTQKHCFIYLLVMCFPGKKSCSYWNQMLIYLTLLSSNYRKHYGFKTFFISASSLFKTVSCFIHYPLTLPCCVVTNVEFLFTSCVQLSGNQGDDSTLFISSSSRHLDGFSSRVHQIMLLDVGQIFLFDHRPSHT